MTNPQVRRFALAVALFLAVNLRAQDAPKETPKEAKAAAPAPKSKAGKKLLSALDTQRVNPVAGGAAELSPDGSRVAYTVNTASLEDGKEWKTLTQVWIVPAAGGPTRQITRGEKNATAPQWSPDGKTLAFLTERGKDSKEGEQQVWFLYADGGEAWQATTHKGGVRDFEFSPDGKKLLFLAADQPSKEEEERKKLKDDTLVIDHDIRMTHLWLFDIEKREEKRLTEGAFTVSDAHWSPDGSRISYTANPTPKADDNGLDDVWILTLAGGEKKKLLSAPGASHSARWSRDGNWIAFTGEAIPSAPVQTHLFVIAASGGAPRKLTASFTLDAGAPVWSADGKTIYFDANDREAMELFAADVATGAVKPVTRKGSVTPIAAVNRDGKFAVGGFAEGARPEEIARIDLPAGGVTRLSDHNAWLDDYALGSVEVVRWKSKDGTEVEGVLTKPVDYDPAKKYPLLLNPHGGPTSASLAAFNSQAQAFAANGYLVLQPNFRGSTGKGEAFKQANKNTWGLGDYEDCITGVQSLVDRGVADGKRLGAVGWSYGGYMTMWILTQTDMFKAVSPGAGLSNIYSMYSQNDIQRYLRWFYSDQAPWDNLLLYWDRSPMKYIKDVKTPAMIVHGQADTRVPIAQAQEFYRGLLENNVPVELVVYPRENHGFTEPRHRMDRMQRYLYFFGKYLENPPLTEPKQ
jgi:dipeptidyl aminopeptidase/acylaminoacyl peptidase